MIKNKSTDRGVSPVIGVVLMIGVTVILAAVVGSTVLDFSGDISSPAQASVEFTEDSAAGTVDVTLMNSRNADIIRVEGPNGVSNISGGEGTDGNLLLKSDGTGGAGTVLTVGGSTPLTSGNEVVVVAESEGGDESVIQTYEFEG